MQPAGSGGLLLLSKVMPASRAASQRLEFTDNFLNPLKAHCIIEALMFQYFFDPH